jgi:hypothetical protein
MLNDEIKKIYINLKNKKKTQINQVNYQIHDMNHKIKIIKKKNYNKYIIRDFQIVINLIGILIM